jgi:3-hydroxybutyryl-CoA dehydrogenase
LAKSSWQHNIFDPTLEELNMKLKEIHKIGVVGEGKMGSSIFLYLNGFDFRLIWLCSSETEKEKALKTFIKKSRLLFHSGVLTESEYVLKSENTMVTVSVDDLKDCDLIIEAITEDIDAKQKLFESLHKVVNANCIFTTNSSSIIPSRLISSERRKDKVAGLHFFFPVPLKNTVELITGTLTSQQTKESLDHFLLEINKRPFHQTESHAFILNRLLLDFQAGAFQVLLEGKFSYKEIDELVRQAIFPIGVFEFFDHVGIDIMLSSVKSYIQNADNKKFYTPLIQKMEELVKLNRLGIKTRHGFYDYAHPEESFALNRNEAIEATEYKNIVTDRLWGYYIQSVLSVIESGMCSREDLACFVKDYMGMDTDPFILNSFA